MNKETIWLLWVLSNKGLVSSEFRVHSYPTNYVSSRKRVSDQVFIQYGEILLNIKKPRAMRMVTSNFTG